MLNIHTFKLLELVIVQCTLLSYKISTTYLNDFIDIVHDLNSEMSKKIKHVGLQKCTAGQYGKQIYYGSVNLLL